MTLRLAATLLLALSAVLPAQGPLNPTFDRDPKQAIDQAYTDAIKRYTTDPKFLSHLVDYLPASKTIPTPAKVLGDISGAPNLLPYAEDVAKYFRLLESSTSRVRVVSIGRTEEGREMIAAAIADEALLRNQKENDARLAKLADPRLIALDDRVAQPLIDQSFPVYYITGTIHSPETGAPTALMELAYRLAVDDSPYIKYIRSHMIVLITPVVEVDGRDRMVDLYRWHKAHPKELYPRLTYWGHYVAHDNNRDAMGMTLALTNNILSTFLGWHAQVLHDLHESVPFLYDNTVGDGPYNAWIDPTLADEWAELGWNNVAQMQTLGMPGVFTHGDFDTWSPGYLMFLAGLHNGISRLYETFGNGGADTVKRILTPEQYSRTWYRQNPPLPTVLWSQRDNNNYEQSALLTTLSYFSQNTHHFLENYYIKSKRSILKPTLEGPAAYVLPADPAELNRQLQLLDVLKLQHVEVQQLTAATTTSVPAPKRGDPATRETLPAGSFIVRLDQPYSRIADALLDRQYWAPDDPQKHPYDDTGWSFPQLFNVKTFRITDAALLKAPMAPAADFKTLAGKLTGSKPGIYAIPNTGQTSLLSLLYQLKVVPDASIGPDDKQIVATSLPPRAPHASIVDKAFDAEGKHFAPGSLLIAGTDDATLTPVLAKLHLDATRLSAAPNTATHPATAPRIAFMHSWLGTQTEGWWRLAFDKADIPFAYISTQTAATELDLRSKYDVIIFAPVGHVSTADIIGGLPMWTNVMPWQKTELTPNLGLLDQTSDTRPGLGYDGLAHLRSFVEHGGLLITCEDTAQFALETGLAPGVSIAPGTSESRVTGSVLSSVFVTHDSPITYGYGMALPVMSSSGMAFNISKTTGRDTGRMLMDPYSSRPTGRGTLEDADVPQGRGVTPPEPLPKQQPWEPRPLNDEQIRNNPNLIPADLRPEVILRFNEGKSLLLSGLLDKSTPIAERAVVVNAHLGRGNVLLFANNPVYRGETIGSYNLVFNAILNYGQLNKAQHEMSNLKTVAGQ